MAKKIIDISKGFESVTESLQNLIKGLDIVDNKLKGIVDTASDLNKIKAFDNYNNLKEVETGIKQVEKASEELAKNEKARIKLLEKLSELEKKEAEANELLEKEIKKNAKAQQKLIQTNKEHAKRLKLLNEFAQKAAENLKELSEKYGANSDEAKKAREELERLNEELQNNSSNSKKLTKAQKALKTAKESLTAVSAKEAQETAILREQANQLRKEQRELAKETLGLIDLYGQQSKELIKSRREYKNLFLETEKNRKGLKGLIFRFTQAGRELKKLEKSVVSADKKLKKLDARVGQNQRSVGDYEKKLKSLSSFLKKIGVVAIALKALEQFQQSINANSNTAAAFEKAIGALGATVGVFVNKLGKLLPTLASGFSGLFLEFKKFLVEIQLFKEELTSLTETDKIKRLKNEIAGLEEEISKSKGFEGIGSSFDGFFSDVEKAIKMSNKLVDINQAARLEIIRLNNNLSLEADALADISENTKKVTEDNESLIQAQSRLEEQSESNFISLEERAKATKDLLIVRAEIQKQEVAIAKTERDLAAERVKLTEIGTDGTAKNIAAREALAEAEKNLAQVTANSDKAIALSKRELRDIETDIIERNLDFVLDDFDRRKTINERIIADETVSFAKREALSKETRRLANKSFRDSIDEINKGIQAGKKKLDFDELVALNDSKAIAKRIQESSLNDKLAGRALEIIKERIQFNRDLEESDRDLNRAKQEGREIDQDIQFQIESLKIIQQNRVKFNKALEDLEEARRKQEIENLNERLKFVEKGSAEELRLKQELFEKLLEQEAKQGEKLIERQKQTQEAAGEVVTSFFEKQFDERLNALDKQIEAIKKRSQELREAAKDGAQDATENLAFQQKKEAEIEKERERVRKQQEKTKLFLALLDSYSAKVASGDPNALQNTLKDPAILRSFVQSFPSFYEGADLTGRGDLDSKGGFMALMHPNEMVFTEEQLKKDMGGVRTRKEVIEGFNLGKSIINSGMPTDARPAIQNNDLKVVEGLKGVELAIKNKPYYKGMDYDTLTQIVTDIIASEGKIERIHRKVANRW